MTIEDTEDTGASPEKKAKTFCCQTFRENIKGSDALKSLKKFLSAAKNSDDVILEYIEKGGSILEILSLIDSTAKGDLTTALPVFEVVHLMLLRFQSAKSEYHQNGLECARNILQNHMLTIKAMLTMNITKQKKVALKLLTAIITLNSSFATEILNTVVLNPTMIADFIQHTSDKESVRKCFILFILSFLIDGNATNIKNIIEQKGYLSSIIPGLKFDEATTVNLALSVFEDKILKNSKIHKTLKLKLFNTQMVKYLFDLYDWKGPKSTTELISKKKNKIKEILVNPKDKELVVDSIHSFLLLLCCSKKHGVAFADKSLGTSEQLNNQLLLTVFESLTDPLKNKKIAEVLLKSTVECPDLMKPLLQSLEPAFQPRESKNWFEAVDFAETLIKTMNPTLLLKDEAEQVTLGFLIKVAKTLCAPPVLLRAGKTGAEKSQPLEVRLSSLKLLMSMWGEIEKSMTVFPKYEKDFKNSMVYFISKYLPDGGDLVELWHNLCSIDFLSTSAMGSEKILIFLTAVLSSLQIIVECQKDEVSPLPLATDMLEHIDLIKDAVEESQLNEIKVKIVQFVEMDLVSLTPAMALFEKSLSILLRLSDSDSLSLASKILTGMNIFKNNKSEIDVWLLCFISVSIEERETILNYFIESLRNYSSFNDSANCDSAISISNGLGDEMEIDEKPATENSMMPFIFQCLDTLKTHFSNFESSKVKIFQRFLCNVIIHLQIFHTTNLFLYDHFKSHKKFLCKSAINYLKHWKNSPLQSSDIDVFPCSQERDLISWLLSEEDTRNIKDLCIIKDQQVLRFYSMFTIVIAYLTKKLIDEDLKSKGIEKYVESLSFFLNLVPVEEVKLEEFDVVSQNLKSLGVLHWKFLNCLFSNSHLLNSFNVFKKKIEGISSSLFIITKVLIGNEIVVNSPFKKKLTETWKTRFLKQFKTKLKKNKQIDDVENLTNVLNFFDYEHSDAVEILNLLIASDIDLFVHKKKLSVWANILVKFLKMHCLQESLSEVMIKKFCEISKYIYGSCCFNIQPVDECFVYLLRSHPRHILMIESEFLNVIMQRSNVTSDTAILVKLLLNDPNKANYFVDNVEEILEKTEQPNLIFSILSALFINDDLFLKSIQSKDDSFIWNISKIQEKNSEKFRNVLEKIYKKFESLILKAMKGEKENVVLNNLDVGCKLVQLFINKKKVIKLKEDISKGVFQPELLYEAVKKLNIKEVTESYLRGLVVTFCKTIKNFKNAEEEISFDKYCSIISNVIESSESFPLEDVKESTEWKEFLKLALGHCFGTSKNSVLLKILRLMISKLYKSGDETLSHFFQMLISHSQFLNIILGKSLMKNELVELFYCLTEKNCFEKSSKHIPIFLAAYSASLSSSDQTLLKILRLYEEKGVGMGDYEPFVWGETAVPHYSVGGNPGLSLWQRFSMANVLDLLDFQRVELSLKKFPIHRSLELTQVSLKDCDLNVYDPAFLLPLFVNLLSPGSVVFCLPFIYKGGLGYTVRALSSECSEIRMMASVVLNRFYNHLEISQNLKQKLVWMHFINCFRYSIKDLLIERVPNITTLFFARMTLELTRQPAEMFRPLQNFLLAKPFFSFETVPEFLPFFHSSDVFHGKQREWLLEVLRDGTKTTSDLNLIYHSMALKVIFCFFHSSLCDNETRKLILQVMERLIKVEKSLLLLSEYSLINWICAISPGSYQVVLYDLLNLISTTCSAIINDIKFHKSKFVNASHLVQILNLAMSLLPAVKSSKSTQEFKIYIKIVFDCFNLLFEENKFDWFKLNKNKLQEIIETGMVVLGEKHNCEKYTQVSFYFRNFDEQETEDGENLKKVVFLFNFLANRTNVEQNKYT